MSGAPESQEDEGEMEGEGEEISGRSGQSEKQTEENPPIEDSGSVNGGSEKEDEGEDPPNEEEGKGESEGKENESEEETSGSSEKQEDSSSNEGKDYEEEEISVISIFLIHSIKPLRIVSTFVAHKPRSLLLYLFVPHL